MNTINLGRITIVSDPTQIMPVVPPPPDGSDNPVISVESNFIDEAQESADFGILRPTHIPSGLGLTQAWVYVWHNPAETFATILKYRESTLRWLVIEQKIIQPDESRMFVMADISQVMVGDRPAASFEQFIPVPDPLNNQISFLFWEQDGFLMKIQCRGVSSTEVIQIVVSMQ